MKRLLAVLMLLGCASFGMPWRTRVRHMLPHLLALAPVAALGCKHEPTYYGDIAPILAGSFARLLDLWRQSPSALLAQAWLARAHPIGSALTVHSGANESVSGAFSGIVLMIRGTSWGTDRSPMSGFGFRLLPSPAAP